MKQQVNEIFSARRQKIYEYLRTEGIDAAVLEDTENRRNTAVRYLTGHPSDAVLFLFAEGHSLLAPWDVHLAGRRAHVDDIIPYNDLGRQYITAVPAVFERKKIGKGSRCEISSSIPFPMVMDLKEKIPGVQIVCRWDGLDAVIASLRMIKDDAEIGLIRNAADITNTVLAKLPALFEKPDLTELEAALFIDKEARELGGEGTGFETIVAGPSRSFGIHAFPAYTRAAFSGEGLSIIDFGILYEGYTSDVTLTVARGKLSKEQNRKLELVREAYDLSISMLRPGTSTRSVAIAVDNLFSRHGETMPHALGHGIGLEAHESPFIRTREDSDTPLAPGMVITMEPGLYNPETGGVRMENDVLITPEGCSVLTSSRIFMYRT